MVAGASWGAIEAPPHGRLWLPGWPAGRAVARLIVAPVGHPLPMEMTSSVGNLGQQAVSGLDQADISDLTL